MDEILLGGDAYRDLRTTLVRYLRRLGSPAAEEIADETVLRVLQNLKMGEEIQDIRAYIRGVARNVYFEHTRHPQTVQLAPHLTSNQISGDAELLDQCLTKCLKQLPPEERSVLKAYYEGEGQKLIKNRYKLAKKLGITLDALRIRVYRNRVTLGKCIKECPERNNRA